MENVILTIHLLLAVGLIATVLLQRSEGGGLGIGGSSGPGGARPSVSAVAKFTWWLAGAFIITSVWLTIIAAQKSADGSVLDRIIDSSESTAEEQLLPGSDLLPPALEDVDTPLPRAE